jgi:RNase P/RNase MRP subunit POP5
MAIKFRKLSIKSRKRTLGLAGLALVMEMVVSHPRFDMAAGVAQVARVAAPAVMASLATLTRSGNTPREAVPEVPAVVPVMEHTAELCAKMRRVES